ncbi:MAG: TAXI family TRAP transporter solute-binding subunit [Firmicutes bacterium]|nr:TAXI family TRAP transporter solute-binding subunit [Bacillota bacterium]
MAMFLVLVLVAGCGPKPAPEGEKKEEPTEKKFVNIATGGTAGTYFPLGGAIADILNKNIDGVNASAQSTGASVANINMLKDGSVEMAFVQNDITYYAATGTEMFQDKKVDGLRGIATLYPETVQIVTLAKTGIKDIADMKGKRVAVGAAGSGTEANARQILEAYGITYQDITVQYLSFAEAASNLKDGNVDAAFVTAGFPTAAIQDIAAQHDVVLLPVDEDIADKLIEKYPFYTKVIIPKDTYPKQAEDVNAVAVMAMLVVTDDMDEQLAYDITKAIYSNLDRLQTAHAVGKMITKEKALDGMSVELHPGAEKYFKE